LRVTNAKSSQNHSVTTREMCDATVTNVRLERMQFIRRASIPDCAVLDSDTNACLGVNGCAIKKTDTVAVCNKKWW